jgi:hypothetical protein
VLAALLLLWMAVVAGRGALLALQTVGSLIAQPKIADYVTPPIVAAIFATYFSCLLAAIATRRLRPAATLPVTYAVGSVIVLVCAISTSSLGPLAIALALIALAWLVGDALLARLPVPAAQIVRQPIAIAMGLGLFGLVLLVPAALAVLNLTTVAGTAGALLFLILMLDRERLAGQLGRLRTWRPAAPSWFETVIMGLTVGLVAFALIAAFVPETMSDAIRQHLPIAREIWQTGTAGQFFPMGASGYPMQSHLLYAVAYGFGGMTAAKLLQSLVGLAAIAGVAGLGWLVAGRMAAVVGAAIFATMPLVLWILGHVYADLFAVLFTVTAASCLLLWQRDGVPWWLIAAGALAGFGFAAKLIMALMVVAMTVALFLTGRRPWQWRERVLAAVTFGLGTLVVVPWLIRSYQLIWISPALPAPLQGTAPAREFFVTMPWLWPFHAGPSRYLVIQNAEHGIALLLLLPLALLAPRTRAVTLLALTAVITYLGWWFTLQNPRHLLPTLAIAAALAGIGVASTIAAGASGPRAALATAARIGVVVGILVVPVFYFPNQTTRLPIDVITGRESAEAYIERVIPTAKVLAAASAALPADTPVGYIGLSEGAQLYTEVRLWPLGTFSDDDQNFLDNQLGTTPEAIFAKLDRLGLNYFIWDRLATRPEDWRSTLLSTAFLRDHARILAGDDDAYLFEVLPDDGKSWGQERLDNMLDAPSFDTLKKDFEPWTAVGKVKASGGVISMGSGSSLAQRVPVSAGSPYLLISSAKCADANSRAELTLRWFDDRGVELGVATEAVIPGVEWSEQFIWRRAPERSASVSAELASRRCTFDEASLYALS